MTQISRLSGIGEIDWGNIITSALDTAGKVLPTVFNHGNTTNQYTAGMQSAYPTNPATQNYPQGYGQQPSPGLSTTSLLLLGGAALVAYKMMKKK